MKVKDIMTANPTCVTPGDSIRDAAKQMKDCDCGLLPVVENPQNRRLVGIVTDRDIAVRAIAQGRGPDTLVRDVMSDGPDALRPEDDASKVEDVMRRRQVRRVPIVDQNGGVVGIVAQADLARRGGISDQKVGDVVEAVSAPRGQPQR